MIELRVVVGLDQISLLVGCVLKAGHCLVVVGCGSETVVHLSELADIVDGNLDGRRVGQVEGDSGLDKYCLL